MATVEEVARACAALTATETDLLLVATWVNQRMKEVSNTNTLRNNRRSDQVTVPALERTGTVNVTLNSLTITGTGTAFTQDHVGQELRARTAWYRIAQVVSATELRLTEPYAEDTTTGAGFEIVQRRIRLRPDVRKIGEVVHQRFRQPLQKVSREGLDLAIPSRFSIASVPNYWAEMEPDTDGTRRIEIYPFSSRAEVYHYNYWTAPDDFDFRDQLPGFVDVESLREGVLIDLYRYKMSQAVEAGQLEQAAFWRNEYRAQETRWEAVYKRRLLSQDNAGDDLEFILARDGAHPRRQFDRVIDDAFDHVWFTGRI